LPNVPESYVHRIGRTARAGAEGSAVAFCAEDERSLLRDIEKVTRQRIPSLDRRGDETLGRLTASSPEAAAQPEGQRGHSASKDRGSRQGDRSQRGGAGRGERRESDPPRGGKPRAKTNNKGFQGQRTGTRSGSDRSSSAQGSKSASAGGGPSSRSAGPKGGGAAHERTRERSAGAAPSPAPSGSVTPAKNVMQFLQASNPWSAS
jgi:ATP-dependent RNA helicase RhlE